MENEYKELLIRDLCARLPYHIQGLAYKDKRVSIRAIRVGVADFVEDINYNSYPIEQINPYLFPLSSMTEEQYKEFNSLTNSVRIDGIKNHCNYYIVPMIVSREMVDCNGDPCHIETCIEDYLTCIDWLNKHHFDFRGLIDMGLALDATGLNIYDKNK